MSAAGTVINPSALAKVNFYSVFLNLEPQSRGSNLCESDSYETRRQERRKSEAKYQNRAKENKQRKHIFLICKLQSDKRQSNDFVKIER
jgi:hypothetical protein